MTKIVSIKQLCMWLWNKRLFFLWQPLMETFEICFQNSIQTIWADTPEGKDKWCELNPKQCGLFGGVLFGEMKFILSNFLSNEVLSISYES